MKSNEKKQKSVNEPNFLTNKNDSRKLRESHHHHGYCYSIVVIIIILNSEKIFFFFWIKKSKICPSHAHTHHPLLIIINREVYLVCFLFIQWYRGGNNSGDRCEIWDGGGGWKKKRTIEWNGHTPYTTHISVGLGMGCLELRCIGWMDGWMIFFFSGNLFSNKVDFQNWNLKN